MMTDALLGATAAGAVATGVAGSATGAGAAGATGSADTGVVVVGSNTGVAALRAAAFETPVWGLGRGRGGVAVLVRGDSAFGAIGATGAGASTTAAGGGAWRPGNSRLTCSMLTIPE